MVMAKRKPIERATSKRVASKFTTSTEEEEEKERDSEGRKKTYRKMNERDIVCVCLCMYGVREVDHQLKLLLLAFVWFVVPSFKRVILLNTWTREKPNIFN